jgi:uroporphyrinogen-III synthase
VSAQPLAGRRILVTRAAHQAGTLSDRLRALGAEPVEVPVLEIRPPESFDPLDRALRQLASYDWMFFTSANAVRALMERMAALGIALEPSPSLKVAAVGAATARAAQDAGFPVTFVPESYVAESLVEGLLAAYYSESGQDESGHDSVGQGFSPDNKPANETGALAPEGETGFVTGHDFSRAEKPQYEKRALAPAEDIAGQRILLARAAVARDVVPDALRAAGARVDVVDAYQNVLPESAHALLREALAQGIDAATFASSSSVTHLAEAAHKAGIDFPFPGVPAVSIGPITSQTLHEAGWTPAAEAKVSDIPGLVAAVVGIFLNKSS